jgi:putative SOS response-associated peptidase YedK
MCRRHYQGNVERTRGALSADHGDAAAQSAPVLQRLPDRSVDVVTAEEGERLLAPMEWRLVPRWWSKPLKEHRVATFNARVETKPFFREAIRRSRCLIPVSGYCEWQTTAAEETALVFHSRWRLTAAGFWDEWKDRTTEEQLKSCTVIITEPNGFVADVHRSHAGAVERRTVCTLAERRDGRGTTKASAE